MMQQINVSVGVAFIAGLVSFFSPCVFSLIPAYIGYLSGRSLKPDDPDKELSGKHTFLHGLAFVFGFSLVFISLGIAISALGQLLFQARELLSKAGGIIIILFGLHMTGLLHIPFFDYEIKPRSKVVSGGGLISSFLMGVLFSAGWSPCVGPTLGMILTLAAEGANFGQGILLLGAYSLGMAMPFLTAALGLNWVTKILQKNAKVLQIAQILTGALLIIVGIMLFLGIYQQMISMGSIFDFGY